MNNLEIKPFDIRNATEAEYRAANTFGNLIRVEQLPNDPPIPLEEQTRGFKATPDFVDVHVWGVWSSPSEIIAFGSAAFLLMQENQHIGEMNIEVLPAYRRQGVARRLLKLIADTTKKNNRRLLITGTNERIPAGEAFMNRLGAKRGLENHTNQLDLADLNRDLVRDWQARAQERATAFEMGLWLKYPEESLADIAQLLRVMNSAPRGDLEIDDFNFTPEQLRQQEQQMQARGTEQWTLYVREKATGKFAGFTEVMWNANRPEILSQGGTGVFPEFRNHGLGRWLKAAMLDKVLRERPQVKYIRTGNADSNAPMLKINHELGFKPYISRCMWQIELSKVQEYLKN